jgi:hypothetical protein
MVALEAVTAPKQITRAIEADEVDDLLSRPRRVAVAFVAEGAVSAIPAALLRADGDYWIGFPVDETEAVPQAGARVSVLVDDGTEYFDLRGARLRGYAALGEAPVGASPELRWIRVVPERIVAWHYGRLRVR